MTPATFVSSVGGGDWLLVAFALFLAGIIWQSSPQAGGMILFAVFLLLLVTWAHRGFTV
jgi:cbb3-type cytochrome oxidase subunit 3